MAIVDSTALSIGNQEKAYLLYCCISHIINLICYRYIHKHKGQFQIIYIPEPHIQVYVQKGLWQSAVVLLVLLQQMLPSEATDKRCWQGYGEHRQAQSWSSNLLDDPWWQIIQPTSTSCTEKQRPENSVKCTLYIKNCDYSSLFHCPVNSRTKYRFKIH